MRFAWTAPWLRFRGELYCTVLYQAYQCHELPMFLIGHRGDCQSPLEDTPGIQVHTSTINMRCFK